MNPNLMQRNDGRTERFSGMDVMDINPWADQNSDVIRLAECSGMAEIPCFMISPMEQYKSQKKLWSYYKIPMLYLYDL